MAEVFPSVVASKYNVSTPRIPNCSLPIKEGAKLNTIIQSFDSGHEQRRQKSKPRRTFDLQYVVLTQDEYLTLRDFFLTVSNVTPFIWTHPAEGTQMLVRFDMDTFAGEYFSHRKTDALYKLSLKLLQVWS